MSSAIDAAAIRRAREIEGLREVAVLAWPIVVSMLSFTITIVFDGAFLSHLGTPVVAAAGLATTFSIVVLSIGTGVVRAVRVVASQRIGAGRDPAHLAAQALWLAAAFSVPALAIAAASPWLAPWIASPELAPLVGRFLAVRLAGAPFLFASSALAAFLQAQGRTRATMIASVASNAATLALDAVLLFGFGPFPAIGPIGAALATVFGWLVGLIVVLPFAASALRRGGRPHRGDLAAILRLGVPSAGQMMLDVSSFAVFSTILGAAGEVDLAAHVIALRINAISFLPGFAISEAGAVLVGRAVGAKRPDEAIAAWRSATILSVLVMAAWGVLFIAVPGVFLVMFGAAPDVDRLARALLVVAAAFQVFDAVAVVAFAALAGAGDARFALIASTVAAWLVKLPLAVLLVWLGFGAAGAWTGLAFECAALAAIGVWRMRSMRWAA